MSLMGYVAPSKLRVVVPGESMARAKSQYVVLPNKDVPVPITLLLLCVAEVPLGDMVVYVTF